MKLHFGYWSKDGAAVDNANGEDMDDVVAMAEVTDTVDGKLVEGSLEQSPGHVIEDEVVNVVVTSGEIGSLTVVPVETES